MNYFFAVNEKRKKTWKNGGRVHQKQRTRSSKTAHKKALKKCAPNDFSISAERFFILLRLIFRFQEDKKTGNVEDENPFPEISFCVLLLLSVSSLESNS